MVEVEVGCARGCEREIVGNMWVAIGSGTVTVRALSGDVEAGLDCVAISGVHGKSGILMFGSRWLWVGGLAE
uniref:Uncharacterized protein n=1 Tax=Fagus sylvatica TaxID=28930 RepID=A0A2N9HXT3_FAGSY